MPAGGIEQTHPPLRQVPAIVMLDRMAADGSDPLFYIRGLAMSGTRFRFPPGVTGKSSLIYVGLVTLWAIVLLRLSPTKYVFDGGLIGCAAFMTWVGIRECHKMRDFAEKNPALAMMEGADVTEYSRFEAEAKGLIGKDRSPAVPDPTPPLLPITPIGDRPDA